MNNQIKEYGLCVKLISFNISPELTKKCDVIINVSTKPAQFKHSISIPVDYCENINHIFQINVKIPKEDIDKIIKGQTELIIFSFRTKEKFNTKRKIAIARLHYSDLLQMKKTQPISIENETKTVILYKTSKDQKNDYYEDLQNGNIDKYEITDRFTLKRTPVGKMKIQLTLCDPFIQTDENTETHSFKNKHSFKQKNEYEKF